MEYKIENGKLRIDSLTLEIDNLTFIEEIGSGANANVFLASNALLNRNEAVKVWIPHKGRSGVDPERFEAEVQKNACFDGLSNIAKLYDAACSNGIYYARLQYIEGQILKDYLVSERELLDRLNIIEKILLTLKAAYEKGVYHGDLHGGNIIVKNNEPFIIDFGTSLFSGEDKSHKRDCRMIIETALKILPELNDFDFFDESVFISQDSKIIIELLHNLSRLVWDIKK